MKTPSISVLITSTNMLQIVIHYQKGHLHKRRISFVTIFLYDHCLSTNQHLNSPLVFSFVGQNPKQASFVQKQSFFCIQPKISVKIHFCCYIIFVDTKAIILTIRDDHMIFGRAQDPPLRLRGRIANGGAANSAAEGGGLPMAVWQTVQLQGGVPRGRREESRLYKCAPKNKRSIVVDFERSDNFNNFVNYYNKRTSSTTITRELRQLL